MMNREHCYHTISDSEMWKGEKFADNIGGKLAMFRKVGIRKQGIRWGLLDLLHCRSVIK
jgi:hypothetical protein